MDIANIRRENLRQLIKTEFKTRAELDLETSKEPGQGLSYSGKFKNLIQAEADDKLDATEKSILEALDLKYKSKKRKGY